MTGWVL